MIKSAIKKLTKHILCRYHAVKNEKFYKQLLRINHIPNRPVEGEKQWCRKWSVFGLKANPIYYRLFSHYIGKDMNIVPENICHDVIEPILNPFKYTKTYADKNLFDKFFPIGYLPQTILRKMNGFYYDANYNRIDMDDNKLVQMLADSGKEKIIIKPTVDGMSGVGVRCFVKEEGIWHLYQDYEKFDFNYLETKCGNDFIIQEFLEQHESIERFCRTSVNTLRLTLYRSVKNDECVVTSAIMRIGNNGSVVDNAHAGGCFVGIDITNGHLGNCVSNQYGERHYVFNGIDFREPQQIPIELWEKVIRFAKTIGDGKTILHHRLIALDLMVDKNGNPRLVEFNIEYYGMWPFQFTMSSAFGDYTDEILAYCQSRRNSIEYQLLV